MIKNTTKKILTLLFASNLVLCNPNVNANEINLEGVDAEIEINENIINDEKFDVEENYGEGIAEIEYFENESENDLEYDEDLKEKVGVVRSYIHASNEIISSYNPNIKYRDYWGDYSNNGRQDYKDLTELFGVSRKDILDTIEMNATNYSRTPYTDGYNTISYPNRGAGFNCEGFVDRVINDTRIRLGMQPINISSSCKIYPTSICNIVAGSSNGWVDGVLAHSGVSYRTYYGGNGLFETIANDGYAEPGDIIWYWCGSCYDSATWGNGFSQAFCGFHHIGIYTGNYFSNKNIEGNLRYEEKDRMSMWHSTGVMRKGGHTQTPVILEGCANTRLNAADTKTVYATVIKWGKCELEEPEKEPSLYLADSNKEGILVGMVVDGIDVSNLEYSWYASNSGTDNWKEIKTWALSDEWLTWTPPTFADYDIKCIARKTDGSKTYEAKMKVSYHPEIKGICQMPYNGEGGGYLIGIESFENPDSSYKYEMLILDCTLLAEGKDAWIYTTDRCHSDTNCLWTIWQPQYGYYWTLFRIFDSNDKMIDEACYGFVNAY